MDIFKLMLEQLVEVLPDLKNRDILPTDSLRDLCPNSIDRMDVLVMTLEALDLNIPYTRLHGPKNLQELCDLLAENIKSKSSIS